MSEKQNKIEPVAMRNQLPFGQPFSPITNVLKNLDSPNRKKALISVELY